MGNKAASPTLLPTENRPTKTSMSAETLLRELHVILLERKQADPTQSYVARLYKQGRDRILQKVGEEATEAILAAKNGDRRELINETADLWFHTLVMLAEQDISPMEVIGELEQRFGCTPDLGLEQDRRGNQRRTHQKKLILSMQNGETIRGVTQDISLDGLCIGTDYEPKWKLLGEMGSFEIKVQNRNRTFDFEVVRITENTLGLSISRDLGLFGFALSDELFRDMF